ncbi:hypothetical protein N7524_011249 [Penicillium chrysogenum]|nr:hypothetical protein N7524_011249 [Penicillium chrysogenum]
MEVEDLATANLSWDLSKGPVPYQLQEKAVDHYLLEVLGYNNGANHTTLRLVFERPQVHRSPYAPANTQGVRMELELQDDTGLGPAEGQLVVTTFTFTGAHRRACVSHGLLVKSGRTVSDFINVAKKVNLTPCAFNSVDSGAAGCRDFMSLSTFYSLQITRNVFGKSEQNEKFTRITLNLLVASHHCVTSHPDNASPDLDATDLHLTAERLLHCGLVIYKGGKYDLIVPDYSLWYGIEKDVALGGVLVEDALGAAATSGVSQILGYMGCVSRSQKVPSRDSYFAPDFESTATWAKALEALKARKFPKAHYEGRLAEATVAFKAAFIPEGDQATVRSGWSCAGCCYNSNASACSFRAEPPDWLIARACHVDSPQRICPISSFWGVIRSTLTATVSYTHHGPPQDPAPLVWVHGVSTFRGRRQTVALTGERFAGLAAS